MSFPVHTNETAPAASRTLLERLRSQIGTVPNLAASMSESPELLRGFLALREIMENGSFKAQEVQVLALANAFENGCRYCMALHSTLALRVGVAADTVAALREGRDPDDPRLGPLTRFSRRLVRNRGQIAPEHLQEFLDAGFNRREALEVVLQVAASVMPNFAHHLTECPVDDAFAGQRWEPVRSLSEA